MLNGAFWFKRPSTKDISIHDPPVFFKMCIKREAFLAWSNRVVVELIIGASVPVRIPGARQVFHGHALQELVEVKPLVPERNWVLDLSWIVVL